MMMTTRIGNSRTKRSRVLLAACGLALATIAPSAQAQVVWQAAESAPAPSLAPGRSESMTFFSGDQTITARGKTADGRAYDIRVKNDNARATLDGVDVPADRLVRTPEKIEILDERGNVVVSIGTVAPPTPPSPPVPGTARTLTLRPTVSADSRTIEIMPQIEEGHAALARIYASGQQDPPKVMVGITMSGVDETLRSHFGLAEGVGVVVDGVIDGLPASRAGVKARDIIVAIDGKEVSNMTLRGTLDGKEPGARVKVRVIRKGETKEMEMTLDAYDPAKLETPGTPALGSMFLGSGQDGVVQRFTFQIDREANQAMQEAQRALEEAMASMRAEGMGDHVAALDAAREQMRKAITEMQAQRFAFPGNEGEIIVVPSVPSAPAVPGTPARPRTPRGEGGPTQEAQEFQVMRGPRTPTPPTAQNTEQLSALERRLDLLDERFNRLDERISRLLDRLERDQ